MALKLNGLLLVIGAALLVYALTAARLGVFIIDEAIYLFAADTFAATGGFKLQNGLHLSQSADLFLSNLLSQGPDGMTSQYPPGSAVVWAPLVERWGVRGIVVFNTACLVAAVFVTFALARRLLSAELAALASLLFLFGTFALEYAFVLWPHSVSVLTVLLAWLLFLQALDADRRAFALAFASGLILGAGVLFRIDNVLAVPAFGLLAILFAARFGAVAFGGIVGLAVPMAMLSLANMMKFGTLNPLSYGVKDGGSTNLSVYVPFAAVLLALAGVAWLVRSGKLRAMPVSIGLAIAVVVAAGVFVPEVQRMAVKYANGVMRLVVDARQIPSPFSGVMDMPDGTRSFWGLSKKALGQSLPWLGVLLILLRPRAWAGQGREIASAAALCVLFTLPFLLRNWHGGMSSNMRYFLPVLPVISILAVVALRHLLNGDRELIRTVLLAVLVGLASSFAWMMVTPSALAGAHQIWALYVFGVAVLASLAWVVVPSLPATKTTLLVAGFGIGVSVFNTATDTLISQLRRGQNEVLVDLSSAYEGKALIYGAQLRSAFQSPDQILAAPQIGAALPETRLATA
ncbi:MAG: glycosyltransferase family 39 protein [Pseudomonadota bacterium]